MSKTLEGDLVRLVAVASESAVALLSHRSGRRESRFDRVEAVFCARSVQVAEGTFAQCVATATYCDQHAPLLVEYAERWIRFRCADLEVDVGDLKAPDAVWCDGGQWTDVNPQHAWIRRVHLEYPKLFEFIESRMTPSLLFTMWKETIESLARVEIGPL